MEAFMADEHKKALEQWEQTFNDFHGKKNPELYGAMGDSGDCYIYNHSKNGVVLHQNAHYSNPQELKEIRAALLKSDRIPQKYVTDSMVSQPDRQGYSGAGAIIGKSSDGVVFTQSEDRIVHRYYTDDTVETITPDGSKTVTPGTPFGKSAFTAPTATGGQDAGAQQAGGEYQKALEQWNKDSNVTRRDVKWAGMSSSGDPVAVAIEFENGDVQNLTLTAEGSRISNESLSAAKIMINPEVRGDFRMQDRYVSSDAVQYKAGGSIAKKTDGTIEIERADHSRRVIHPDNSMEMFGPAGEKLMPAAPASPPARPDDAALPLRMEQGPSPEYNAARQQWDKDMASIAGSKPVATRDIHDSTFQHIVAVQKDYKNGLTLETRDGDSGSQTIRHKDGSAITKYNRDGHFAVQPAGSMQVNDYWADGSKLEHPKDPQVVDVQTTAQGVVKTKYWDGRAKEERPDHSVTFSQGSPVRMVTPSPSPKTDEKTGAASDIQGLSGQEKLFRDLSRLAAGNPDLQKMVDDFHKQFDAKLHAQGSKPNLSDPGDRTIQPRF
jgi:hypothetical protein